jgi:hypothetical protein
VNVCAVCGEDFGSVSAFDAHRTGRHEHVFSPQDPEGRRCFSAGELIRRGWTRDGRGRLRRPSDGAPWASRETQVTTQERAEALWKDSGRAVGARPPARLPDAENARLAG